MRRTRRSAALALALRPAPRPPESDPEGRPADHLRRQLHAALAAARKPAPITVSVEGLDRHDRRHPPPALRQLEIALNRNGRISTRWPAHLRLARCCSRPTPKPRCAAAGRPWSATAASPPSSLPANRKSRSKGGPRLQRLRHAATGHAAPLLRISPGARDLRPSFPDRHTAPRASSATVCSSADPEPRRRPRLRSPTSS